jgi:hypothetical protein
MVTVPDPALEEVHSDASFVVDHASEEANAVMQPASEDDVASPDDTKVCPMCGASIKKAAVRCRFCGETLTDRPTNTPTTIDAGDIISRSWTIYKDQLAVVLGAFVVQIGIGIVLAIGIYAILGVTAFAMLGPGGMGGGAGGPRFNPAQMPIFINVVALIITPLIVAINAYFDAGMHVLLLKVARGERAEIGDLFSAGRFYWRAFLVNLVFAVPGLIGNLMDMAISPGGSLLGVVGQLLLLLFFWPCVYVLVDRDVGVGEAFSQARTLAALNYGPTVLLALFMLLLGVVGFMACCIGWIFAFPLGMLTFGVAYCAMSGQAIAGSAKA